MLDKGFCFPATPATSTDGHLATSESDVDNSKNGLLDDMGVDAITLRPDQLIFVAWAHLGQNFGQKQV